MKNEVLVSIICTTFNHENYIADSIEGFLMQHTNFGYEILIHDDASTDGTVEIVKYYERKHPTSIKPIYQKENQYSKGVNIIRLIEERAVGKYIAICEGDDYWIDPHKLQKQVDFLETNTEYTLCVHAAKVVDAKSKKVLSQIRPSRENKTFSTEEVIYKGGGLFATNSMIFRRKGSEVKPDFYNNASVGDYPLTVFLSLIGKVYYMNEFMSSYRTNVEGSWTSRNSFDLNKVLDHINKTNLMLDEINDYTKGKYLSIIEETILRNEFKALMVQMNYREIKKGKFRSIYATLSIIEKIKINIKQYFPFFAKHLKDIRRKCNLWITK